MSTLRWADLSPRHAGCHVARTFHSPNAHCPLHDHDFAEVCWIESGQIRHTTPHAATELKSGDCLLIRPRHQHGFAGLRSGGWMVNIAVPDALLREYERRYAERWPWTDAATPTRCVLAADDLATITRRFHDFSTVDQADALDRDAFLCDLLSRLRRPITEDPSLPAWLAAALRSLAEPQHLREGLSCLPRLTGRSREHVSRTLRAAYRLSPTELLQRLRLRHAERLLALGDDSVAVVAEHCGFAGLAHFHRLFRSRFGRSPAAHRRACRRTVGG